MDFSKDLIAGLWLRAAAAYSDDFLEEHYRLGTGPALLIRYNYLDRLSLLGEAWYRYDNQGIQTEYREFSLGGQYNFSDRLGLRLNAEENEHYKAEFQYYY